MDYNDYSFYIEVIRNNAPVVTSSLTNVTLYELDPVSSRKSHSQNILICTDPESDALAYELYINGVQYN